MPLIKVELSFFLSVRSQKHFYVIRSLVPWQTGNENDEKQTIKVFLETNFIIMALGESRKVIFGCFLIVLSNLFFFQTVLTRTDFG